ncbi:hypothetical protein DL764_002400 [Monosporascus ibericus]|uniref:Uncharacterized protein n=1 Tax=Monosporascus ibericus TaxID=155417 RepID=A0A4Q4TMB6_9PEZI|nr:hypothetical protein DL764_002400 [Monosporascus ibericus]
MCIQTVQSYKECSHYSASTGKCPTYHKQQGSARGFFGFLSGKSTQGKDCGRLAHHYAESTQAVCEKCVVTRSKSLQGRQVGHGAALIQRRTVDDDFRKDRKRPAKETRTEKRGCKHRVVKSQSSVWLPDVYHVPGKFAQTEAHRRTPAMAWPVSPLKASGSSRTKVPHKKLSARQSPRKTDEDKMRKPREGHLKDSYDYRRHEDSPGVLSVSASRTPAFGYAPPLANLIEPAPTHQYRPRYAAHVALLPPAVGLPPRPWQIRKQGSSSQPTASSYSVSEAALAPTPARAVAPPEVLVGIGASSQGKKPESSPHLRRKQAKTHLNIRNRPLGIIPAPLPEYQGTTEKIGAYKPRESHR